MTRHAERMTIIIASFARALSAKLSDLGPASMLQFVNRKEG